MKKILSAILTLILALSLIVCLTSCDTPNEPSNDTVSDSESDSSPIDDPESEKDGENVSEDKPDEKPVSSIPEGYKLYDDGCISFAYPELWQSADSTMILFADLINGNNINVVYQPYTGIYASMTKESYIDMYAPIYANMGISISEVSVEQLTNKTGKAITKISHLTEYSGATLQQTQFVLCTEKYDYLVTISENSPVSGLAETVFDTFDINTSNEPELILPDESPENYQTYEDEYISFEYPVAWFTAGDDPVILVNETGAGNCIALAYEPYSDVYSTMTVESFYELLVPLYEEMGLPIYDATVEHVKNANDIEITKITYMTESAGVEMQQTLYIFTAGEYSYNVTITEVSPLPEIKAHLFDTINVLK